MIAPSDLTSLQVFRDAMPLITPPAQAALICHNGPRENLSEVGMDLLHPNFPLTSVGVLFLV